MNGSALVGCLAVVGVVGCVPLGLAACSSTTVPVRPAIPTFASSVAPSSVAAVVDRELAKDCQNVVTPEEVEQVLGHRLTGSAVSIVGVPEPTIKRTGRLDCYYAVPDGQPATAAPIWMGLATYADEQTAQGRARATVDDARAKAVPVTEVPVGPDRGSLLGGPEHMLVEVHGKTTVLVTSAPGVVPDDKVGPVLAELAVRALSPH